MMAIALLVLPLSSALMRRFAIRDTLSAFFEDSASLSSPDTRSVCKIS